MEEPRRGERGLREELPPEREVIRAILLGSSLYLLHGRSAR